MPSRLHLGGLSPATHQAVALCQAAGYGLVMLETVGVGQSEIEVSLLADMVVLVLPPAAGDALQGIKKGIMETADLVVVNKDDGQTQGPALQTAQHYQAALMLQHSPTGIPVQVLRVSAYEGRGIAELATQIENWHQISLASGLAARRAGAQARHWLEAYLRTAWQDALTQKLDGVDLDTLVKDLGPAQLPGLAVGMVQGFL